VLEVDESWLGRPHVRQQLQQVINLLAPVVVGLPPANVRRQVQTEINSRGVEIPSAVVSDVARKLVAGQRMIFGPQ
jgi:hypothetical protein